MSLRIIGGKFRGRILKTPKSEITRPTMSMLREAFFNICSATIEGAKFLDLFAGSGAIGIEAISRGAKFVTCVEQNPQAIHCIKENIELLKIASQIQVLKANVLQALDRLDCSYDIIYIDPPYDQAIHKVFESIDRNKLLSFDGSLFLEQRYKSETKLEENPFHLVDARRYATAQLYHFRHKE